MSSIAIRSHVVRKPFTPAGATTGIGSLPLTSAESAIRVVAEFCPQVPFWPQLPQLSVRETAIAQGLGCLSDLIEPRSEGYGYQVKDGEIDAVLETLHRSDGALVAQHAAGFGAFESALSSGLFPSAEAVKGQIEGPITLSAYLFHQGRSFLSDPAFFAAIAFHVSQTICWQIERLRRAGLPVLLFLDEPALCLAGTAGSVSQEQRITALAVMLEDARTHGAYAGLHCCATRPFERTFERPFERPFERMCRAKPDILSFDADEGLELFLADWHAIEFINQGGIVAYGLVPTRPGLTAIDSASIFLRWLKAVSHAGDPQRFAQRAMITSTCGLGLLDVSAIAESFGVANSVSKLIRNLAGATSNGFDSAG